MSIYKNIVITVPHSYCLDKLGRHCDTRAREVALALIQEFNKFKNVKVHYFPNNTTLRSELDLNRSWSRNHSMRQKIDKLLNSLYENNNEHDVLLLDIHSFPNNSDSFKISGKPIPKIVILDTAKDIDSNLTNTIYDKIKQTIPEINKLIACEKNSFYCKSNDIIVEGKKINDALLLEFNEDDNYFTRENIIDFVSNFTKSIMSIQNNNKIATSHTIDHTTNYKSIVKNKFIILIIICILLIIIIGTKYFYKSYDHFGSKLSIMGISTKLH